MQVVVDAVEPTVIVSATNHKTFDFATMNVEELHNIDIPINLQSGAFHIIFTVYSCLQSSPRSWQHQVICLGAPSYLPQ